MKFVEHKLATGAMLTGYLRDETTEMPSYNTRPAVLILPGGGYRYCSPREADPVAVQFLQAGYHVFTLIYSTDHAPLLWQPLTEAASAILYLRRNAADLRIAADKITIVGFSAGAHLAASTALLWDAAPVQQALGITGTEARPNAVVTVVALYDRPQLLPLPEMYGKNLTFKTGGVDGCHCGEILDLIAAGRLDTTPLITHTFPLREIDRAYDLFEHHRDGVLKVAIECGIADATK